MKIITQNTQLQILFISLLFFTTTVFAQVGIGLTAPLNAQFTVNQDAIFNESGGAFNFRVETDNNPNMLFINGTSNRIGINTATPASQLQFISTGVTGIGLGKALAPVFMTFAISSLRPIAIDGIDRGVKLI